MSTPNATDLSVHHIRAAAAAAAVTNISQDAEGVTVTLTTGEVLRAPYALVTLPLGVLKEASVGFEPPLPAAKQAAVNDMVRGQPYLGVLLLLLLSGHGWVCCTRVLLTQHTGLR
jgi:hypothetical protein